MKREKASWRLRCADERTRGASLSEDEKRVLRDRAKKLTEKDVNPCQREGDCEEPTGSLYYAAAMERAFSRDERKILEAALEAGANRSYEEELDALRKVDEILKMAILEAEQVCAEDRETGKCAAAWDAVEELSAESAHRSSRLKRRE